MTEISGKALAKSSVASVKPKVEQPAKKKPNPVKSKKPAPKKPAPPITSGRTGVLTSIKNKAVEYIGVASDSLDGAVSFINDTLSTISIVGGGYVSSIISEDQKPVPVGERAFKKVFNVSNSDMENLRQAGILDGDPDFMTISQNVLMACEQLSGSATPLTTSEKDLLTLLDKIKERVDALNDYVVDDWQISSLIDFESDQTIKNLLVQRNDIIRYAFMESWSFIKDDEYFGPVKDIADKYGISDPLSLAKADYQKMSIREEMALKQAIQYTISMAISNLSSAQFEKYMAVRNKISERIEQVYLEHLTTTGSPNLEMALRVSQANEISDGSGVSAPDLEGLSWKQTILLNEFIKSGKNLASALTTSDANDDADATKALEKVRQAILREIESSYMDAFVDKPTAPEKQEFKNFIRAASELEINDKKLVFYSRAAESVFSDQDRKMFLELEALGEDIYSRDNMSSKSGKTWVSFGALGTMTADEFISRYSEKAGPFLEQYAKELRKNIENHVGNKIGRTKAEAFFYLLASAGCSEEELLQLDAIVAAEYLSAEDKAMIFSGDKQSAVNILLERIRGNFDKEDFPKKEQMLNNLILYAAVGSISNGNQLMNTELFNIRFGSRILSELETAEYTPELTDDLKIRNILSGFSQETGIDAFQIASAHLRARKWLNMPPDDSFLASILDRGYFMNLTGAAGPEIDGVKMEIMNCLIANEFENQKGLLASKKKIESLYLKMLADAKENISNADTNEALSIAYNTIMLAGNVRELLEDFKIFTPQELDQLSADNNIIPLSENISLRDFNENAGRIFRTHGFDSLPEEFKQHITAAGYENLFRERLNDIVWVPYVEGMGFSGFFSKFNNNLIAVLYQTNQGAEGDVITADVLQMLSTLAHEVGHRQFDVTVRAREDYDPRIDSSLVDERFAHLFEFKFLKALGTSSEADFSPVLWANKMLDLPHGDYNKLNVPLDNMRPYSLSNGVFDVHPGSTSIVNSNVMHFFETVLSKEGYSNEDKKVLHDFIYLSASSYFKPRIAVSSENRSQLVHFMQKLMGLEPTGLVDKDFMDTISQIKKDINDESAPSEISLNLLIKLMGDR